MTYNKLNFALYQTSGATLHFFYHVSLLFGIENMMFLYYINFASHLFSQNWFCFITILILFNFVELDSSVFTNSTERFAEAINISLAQITYVKTLSSIMNPTVH